MKTIGLLGGMSWASSAEYYRLINEQTSRRLGGHHSARCVLASLDFADVVSLQRSGAWDEAGDLLAAAGRQVERAGADLLLLCTNLMHKVAEDIEAAVNIPFVHIADVVGKQATDRGLRTLGLLGARWTMEEDFYLSRLKERHHIDVLVPDEPDRTLVDKVIYDELTRGRVEPASRDAYRAIISRLADRGAEGVILGCTEITLLVTQDDSPIPLIDSTRVHAEHAVTLALTDD